MSIYSSSSNSWIRAYSASAELKFWGVIFSAVIVTSKQSLISAMIDTMSKESRILSSIRVSQVSKSTTGCRSLRIYNKSSISFSSLSKFVF